MYSADCYRSRIQKYRGTSANPKMIIVKIDKYSPTVTALYMKKNSPIASNDTVDIVRTFFLLYLTTTGYTIRNRDNPKVVVSPYAEIVSEIENALSEKISGNIDEISIKMAFANI
jgi:hypothetical protein